jgi:hypothetical protein
MQKIKYNLVLFSTIMLFLFNGCNQYPVIQEPDSVLFNKTIHSAALRDSLNAGKLTKGMSRFVVNQLFKNWSGGIKEIQIPVASLGSKQRLEESEGWTRKYVDPDINVFLDKYDTPDGQLYVWYQRPDLYSMGVSARDTFCVYLSDTVICSVINFLNTSLVLTIRDSLPEVPVRENLYAEVRYNDHPWREVSYWYNVEMLSNCRTFKINQSNYEFYPIELIEFNREPVASFRWRGAMTE